MIKELIKKTVNQNPGIKGVNLVLDVTVSLSKEVDEWEEDAYFEALEDLVSQKEIIEVEYVLPGLGNKIKSIYFPKGTDVRLLKTS